MTGSESDEVFDFYEQLSISQKWEKLLEPVLGELVWEDARRISHSDNPGMQLAGIDHILVEREIPDDAIETKVITQKYDNIFYETRHESVDQSNEWDGWVYKYDNRVLLWAWLSDDGHRIVDARWLLVNDAFRMWFDGIKDNYPELKPGKPTEKDGHRYWSYGVPIPLDRIKRTGFIRAADAAIGLKSNTEQTELVNFNDK